MHARAKGRDCSERAGASARDRSHGMEQQRRARVQALVDAGKGTDEAATEGEPGPEMEEYTLEASAGVLQLPPPVLPTTQNLFSLALLAAPGRAPWAFCIK